MYRALAEEMVGYIGRLAGEPGSTHVDKITEGEHAVLGYLCTHRDVRPGDLAEDLRFSSAHVAKTLRNLEAKGEITRVTDRSDRRKTLIYLNDSGRKRTEEGWNYAMNEIAKMLETLGEQDAREFVRLLGRLAEASQKK